MSTGHGAIDDLHQKNMRLSKLSTLVDVKAASLIMNYTPG